MTDSPEISPARPVVAVFGSNDPEDGSPAYRFAFEVGRVLGECGCDVVNGGYGGTMAASARGARQGGGSAIGVLVDRWGRTPNPYIDRAVHTATLAERIDRLVELADAGWVVLPGATGTLLELATVWEGVAKKILAPRPIVCAGAFWRPLIEMMAAVRAKASGLVSVIEEPAELVEHFPPRG
jgi:hypothetical protein